MKSFKYFLVLPMLMGTLAGCGGKGYSASNYENAKTIVENYKESITANKASSITVGGHINKIAIKGDATFWSYQAERGVIVDRSLLSVIPNFSFENGELNVGQQEIADFSIPGSLLSLASVFKSKKFNMKKYLVYSNLPKFPMNRHLLKLINGFEFKKPKNLNAEEIDWDKDVIDKDWENATVSYGTSGGKLKITITAEDFEAFYDEIESRIPSGNKTNESNAESKEKYAGSFTLTTNEIGYIDSISVNFKITDIDAKAESSDLYYLHIKGELEMDFTLKFKQKISDPVTIKYQLTPYHITDPSKESADVFYNVPDPFTDFGAIPLTKDEDKVIGPTTDLDQFKDYVTFDWYKNLNGKELGGVYDDPIFNINYWNDSAKNIAYTGENYDVLVYPKYDAETEMPKYFILGGESRDFGVVPKTVSLVTTSMDGKEISSKSGLMESTGKILDDAADSVQNIDLPVDEDGDTIPLPMDEIFINTTMLNPDSEYIVNIAVADITALFPESI